MVFGFRLFGGGGARSQSADSSGSAGASAASVPAIGVGEASSLSALDAASAASAAPGGGGTGRASSILGGSGTSGGALTYADSSPPEAAVCPPLTAVPPHVLESHPELALSSYNLTKSEICVNVLAIVHNAARVEMADMCGDILPCLRARSGSGADATELVGSGAGGGTLPDEDIQDLRKWWAGFARFICTSSLVEDMVVKKAFEDVYVGFRKETRAVEKLYHKIQEKNNVYLELAVKKMANAVADLASNSHDGSVIAISKAWNVLYSLLTDIYTMSEDLVNQIDRFGTEPLEYKDLEKSAAKIYAQRKRWGDKDEEKRGEMIVILTRWMADEAFMRNWMSRHLSKSDLHRANKWMDEYRTNRLVLVDRFHHKRLAFKGADHDPEISVRGPAYSTSQSSVIV